MRACSFSRFSFVLLAVAVISCPASSWARDSERLRSHLDRAKRSLAAKDYAGSLEASRRALEEDPRNRQALDLIEKAQAQMVVDPSTGAPLGAESRYALQRLFESGVVEYNKGNYSRALDLWEKVVSQLPKNDELRIKIAELRREGADAPTPLAEDAGSLLELSQKLKSALDPALDELRRRVDETQRDTERAKRDVIEAIERGHSLFIQNRFDEAIAAWREAQARLPEKSRTAPLLEAVEAEAAAFRAAPPADASIGGSAALLEEALKRASASLVERARAQSQEDRRRFAAAVAKGEELFAAGRVDEALAEWRLAASQSADAPSLLARIDAVQRERTMLLGTGTRSATPASPGSSDLAAALQSAETRLRAQAQVSRESADKTAQAAALHQRKVEMSAAKADALYRDGRVDEAISEWGSLAVLTGNDPGVLRRLASVREAHEQVLAAKEQLRLAEARAATLPAVSRETLESLDAAVRELQRGALEASKQAAQAVVADEQQVARVGQDLAEASRLYGSGKIDEAIALWERSAACFSDGEKLLVTVARIKDARAALIASQQQYELELKRSRQKKVPVPEELLDTLRKANTDLAEAVKESRKDLERVVREIDSRKGWAETKFLEGKLLYDQGKYSSAIAIWESLEPFLKEDSRFMELISGFKQASKDLSATNSESARAYTALAEIDRMIQDSKVPSSPDAEKASK